MPDSLAILIYLAYLDIKESSKNCTVGLYLEDVSVVLYLIRTLWGSVQYRSLEEISL